MANSLQEVKKKTVDVAEKKIFEMQEKGEIDFPNDYSVGNALKSVWLKLQETKDRSGNSVLHSCSRTSIVNAMLDTVIQGLTPAKSQIYYIAYGKTLVAQNSYFGNITLAKRFAGVKEVKPATIYEGDNVKVEVVNGNRQITKHETGWDNQNDDKVKGVYCVVTFDDDRPDKHEIMTLDEVKKAWSQGQVYKEGKKGGTHGKFTAEMAKKTVVNRALKPLINSSTDSYLMKKSIDRSADTQTEQEVKEQIEKNNATEEMTIEGTGEELYEEPEEDDVDEDIKKAADALDEDDPF